MVRGKGYGDRERMRGEERKGSKHRKRPSPSCPARHFVSNNSGPRQASKSATTDHNRRRDIILLLQT